MKIAVVGLACHYPGAQSGKELFENILAGRRFFREMPANRWASEDYYHKDKKNPDTTYCKKAAVIEGFDFDPSTFKIPRSTYLATDVTQWLALKVSQQALIDANQTHLPKERTAAIIGNTLTGEVSRATLVRYRWPYAKRVIGELLDNFQVAGDLKSQILAKVEDRYKQPFPPINEDNLAGGLSNTIAGRIANYFDLKGGAFTTDGACSSSLLAINQACIGLDRGDFDVAISGGVDISLDPFEIVGFAKVGALSNEDIRVYDQNSSGFLPGEGCGIVVLKRLSDAINDQDKIYAVVNGVGISSDGSGGITAPSINGQSLAVDRAYESAGYSFADVELIEGHGTGTTVGDNVELNTFRSAKIRHGANEDHHCGLGSIKSNLGHTKAAAGVAGFLKATMAIHYGFLPPTKGIRTPNKILLESEHLYPLMTGKHWDLGHDRRAAVSSAGFGGINTHVTLSSHENSAVANKQDRSFLAPLLHSFQDSEAFFIGAENIADLKQNISLLLTAAGKIAHAELVDLAKYCVEQFKAKNLRLGIVAASPEQLDSRLNLVLNYLGSVTSISEINYLSPAEGIFIRTLGLAPRITFLFPGQGSQYLNMGEITKARDSQFAKSWVEADEILHERLDRSLSSYVFAEADRVTSTAKDKMVQQLNDTSIAQPAITAASIAMTNYLKRIGITPDFAIGHSLGEYTALWSAGVLDLASTLQLVAVRGDAMAKSADVPGAMLSVGANADAVNELVKEVVGYVTISNYNSPKQTVVSGEQSAIESLYELCSHHGYSAARLAVSSAFHSKLMDNAAEQMGHHLEEYEFKSLEHFVVSTATGKLLSKQDDLKKILVDQITNPVQFIDAINTAVEEDCRCFIEVGPGTVLSRLTERIVDKEKNLIFSTDIGNDGGQSYDFNSMLAFCYASGLPIVTSEIYKKRFSRPITLPYEPQFIGSPCETIVEPLDLNLGEQVSLRNGHDQSALQNGAALKQPANDVAEPEVSEPEASDEHSPESIFSLMQAYIADEYGYSLDMISHQAHLQADLGLDSLKSIEIIFEAMGHVGVRSDAASLGDISLIDIATHIHDLLTGKVEEGSSKTLALESALDDWVRAFAVKMLRRKLSGKPYSFSEGKVLIAASSELPILTDLSNAIQALGMVPVVVVGEHVAVSDLSIIGCIAVADASHKFDVMGENFSTSQLYEQPRLLMQSAQALISSERQAEKQFFAYVVERGGSFGTAKDIPENLDMMTGAGFVRTLHLENPSIQTRVIDLNPSISNEDKVRLILDEICHGKGHVDAGYQEVSQRSVPTYELCQSSSFTPAPNVIGKNDVVLVTGGGKGITAECLLGLAEATGIKVAIVGSSELPTLDGKTDKGQELLDNLERFRKLGIDYQYYQCNVLNPDDVAQLFVDVSNNQGEVRGIIHAAGVNILHRLNAVEWPEFLHVLRPKMEGLLNIINSAELSKLKLLSVFSSVIAHSGMMGNSDYSYANEWMSLLLKRLQAEYPHIQCQANCFSVWSEVGMGANLGSLDVLHSIGVSAIPLKQGVQKFVDMTLQQWPNTDLVISSRMGTLDTVEFVPHKLPKHRFIENVLYQQPGVELISEVFLDPQVDRYLEDHDYEGALLFPAVMGIEAMVECATACLSPASQKVSGLPRLQNLTFDRAIIVPNEGRAIRIYAQISEPDKDGQQIAKVMIRSSVTNYEIDYFTAECVWGGNVHEVPHMEPMDSKPLALNPADDLYGKILFQGPMFQNIECYQELSSTHCLARIAVPGQSKVFSKESKHISIYGSAEVRDTFLHAVQLCVPKYKILPISMDTVTYQPCKTQHVYLNAIERERTNSEFLYDLQIFDEGGMCVETITGFRCRIMGDYEDQENLSTIYAAHNTSTANASQEVVA